MVVDELARRTQGSFRSKFSGQLAEVRLDALRLALLKPETYMNESGRAVGRSRKARKLPKRLVRFSVSITASCLSGFARSGDCIRGC